jgi:hypothetical protein
VCELQFVRTLNMFAISLVSMTICQLMITRALVRMLLKIRKRWNVEMNATRHLMKSSLIKLRILSGLQRVRPMNPKCNTNRSMQSNQTAEKDQGIVHLGCAAREDPHEDVFIRLRRVDKNRQEVI